MEVLLMAVLETDLMPQVAREVGDTDSSNLYYTADQIFSAINDGLKDYNRRLPRQFAVVGSGNSAQFSPDPNEEQQRLIVLFAARHLLKGELAKQSRQAVIHTNPTGRTDLSKRPDFTLMALKEKEKEIETIIRERREALVNAEIHDGGGSAILKGTNQSTIVEGLPITIITTTV